MNIQMTDLEERLAQPGGKALLAELVTRFTAMEAEHRSRMGLRPIPRQEFEHAFAFATAAQAARTVLTSLGKAE